MKMSFPASRQIGLIITGLLTLASLSHAQLNIPGADGSDGPLVITNNTVIDLSQAVTAAWDASNAANVGKGVYDSNKWAVVFKYSSVTISTGATVTFKNHASRAPVVWLVQSNVTINGGISLNGQDWAAAPGLAEAGPGGFRGGSGLYAFGVGASSGFGPGGATSGNGSNGDGYGGSYRTLGSGGSSTYGNPSLLPLIGGSGGGGGDDESSGFGGAGGGGAILIACAETLSLTGWIRANGGLGKDATYENTGGGSGGGIRLVANTLSGVGSVQALGGSGQYAGGLGCIRIERVINSNLQVTPATSPVTLAAGSTPLIWLPEDGPTARIVSIGAVGAPADPRASFGTFGADVTLPQVSTTPVIIETTIAEPASTVRVRVSPRANGNYTETIATLQTNNPNPLVLRWLANVPVNPGYSAVQVRVVRP